MLPGHYLIRDAHGCATLHRFGSDGMGALPHRPAGGHTRPICERDSRAALSDRAEAAGEDRGGAVSDRRRRCPRSMVLLEGMEAHGHINSFQLGAHDVSSRLLIPEKLYGREREIEAFLASFDRVV